MCFTEFKFKWTTPCSGCQRIKRKCKSCLTFDRFNLVLEVLKISRSRKKPQQHCSCSWRNFFHFLFYFKKVFFSKKKKKTLTLKHLHFLMNEKLVDLIPIKRSHTCTQTFNHTYTPIFNVRWHSVYIQSTPEAHTLCTHESFWVKFYLGRRSVILIMSDLTCVKYSSPDGHPTGFIGRPWEAKNITHTNIIYISISHPLLVDWI